MNRSCYGLAICVLAVTGTINASVVTSDPYLFGGGRSFRQIGPPTHFVVGDSFFDIWVDINMGGPPIPPPPVGTTAVTPLPTQAINGVSMLVNGLPPSGPVNVLPGSMSVQTTSLSSFAFETKIVALDYQLSLPGSTISIRQSPTTQSTGGSTITPLPAGQYRIESFFDVWVELSIDDGQTWTPATNGPSHIELVPAPGMAPVLGLGALITLRRRR